MSFSLRATTVSNITGLYDSEKAKVTELLGQTNTVELTGDYWTLLVNTATEESQHIILTQWELQLHASTVMKIEERYLISTCAEHILQVARQWDTERKFTILTADSARNMIAVARELPV